MKFSKITKFSLIGLMMIGLSALSGCDNNSTKYVDIYPASVPSGVYTVTGDRQVTIYWSAIVEHDFDYYVAWRSDYPAGPYEDIGSTEETSLVDDGLTNGHIYYFAVSSVDTHGNESDLSYEMIFDTPRPEGSSSLRDFQIYPENSGYSLENERVVPYDDASCDFYVDYDNILNVFFIVAGRPLTDVQDFGYTDNLNDVDYAPLDGWSDLGYVEAILGHSYVLWTADDHYAVVRITGLSKGTYTVGFDFAYQVDLGNRELKIAPTTKIKKPVSR